MADTSQPDPPSIEELMARLSTVLDTSAKSASLTKSASNYPYYREHFADQVLETIDTVVKSRTPIIWPAAGISVNALYQKWTQASAFIKDNYAKNLVEKLDLVTASKHKSIGMKISPRASAVLCLADQAVDWRPDLMEYIEKGQSGEVFNKIGLLITEEDKKWITNLLAPIASDYVTDIQPNKILIIKL